MSASGRGPSARRAPQRVATRTIGRAAALLLALLAACGGGGDGGGSSSAGGSAPASCSVADQKAWLDAYLDDWYFWWRSAPRPDAGAYTDVESYFHARLYAGTDPAFPADRWSRSESTVGFDRFFGEGASLGYGVAVAALELGGDSTRPLFVRYVEPLSPGAAAGVQRGDEVLSLDGRSAASLIAADDFGLLTAASAGQQLTLVLRRGAVTRTVVLTAAVYALTPVTGAAVVQTAAGRKVGYVQVKDMIGQALAPYDAAFASFKAAGVADLVLDLRYNGGGLVSTGATIASYVAGARAAGAAYATLLYNEKHASSNQTFAFADPASALGLARVLVLAGERTCSASEQVVNGLRGAGLTVVTVGDTTCGKPVGFVPVDACGRTYSIVNFESVNARGEGRYFDGFAPTCAVAEDFSAAQGSSADPLVAAALHYADSGACPPRAGAGSSQPLGVRRTARPRPVTDERQGMVGR